MIKTFDEGNTYSHPNHDEFIFILGVVPQLTSDSVQLAILWVDKESLETTGYDVLKVPIADYKDWERVDI